MYVCMYVCICGHAYGRIFQPIVTKFGKNLPSGSESEELIRLGSKFENAFPLAPLKKIGGVNRHFKPNLQKIQIVIIIFETIHRISIKFDRPMWPNERTLWVVRYNDVQIQDGGRPPSWISILGHNFGVGQHFSTKFYTEMENLQPEGSQCSKIRFSKIQDGGRPPSWISILGHHFGVDQHFCVVSLLDQPRRVLHSG